MARITTPFSGPICKNMQQLNVEHYSNNEYNYHRRQRIMMIGATLRGGGYDTSQPHHNYLATLIEDGCYKDTMAWALNGGISQSWNDERFARMYNIKCHRVQKYLNCGRIPHYLVMGNPEGIVKLPPEEVWASMYADDRAEIEGRRSVAIEKKYSTQYGNCRKCGKAYAEGKRVQMRALDEGVTIVVTCGTEDCGNVWHVQG